MMRRNVARPSKRKGGRRKKAPRWINKVCVQFAQAYRQPDRRFPRRLIVGKNVGRQRASGAELAGLPGRRHRGVQCHRRIHGRRQENVRGTSCLLNSRSESGGGRTGVLLRVENRRLFRMICLDWLSLIAYFSCTTFLDIACQAGAVGSLSFCLDGASLYPTLLVFSLFARVPVYLCEVLLHGVRERIF